MHLAETQEQQDLRAELREYFENMLTPEVREELGAPGQNPEAFRRCIKQLGDDGWLGLAWPVEYGGQGRSAVEQFIMFDEIQRAHAPFPFVTVNTVGPAIMAYGTDEQKERYLPGILAGELNFAVGYTEPEAGTDLASLRTSAVVDGDEFVINGSKVYTSGANQADFIWLAARTDPDVKKHKGISMLIVPTDAEGFEWTPLHTVGGHMTTSTYYTDVRVPLTNIVGELNQGWQLITMQLNHERVGLAALSGLTNRLMGDVVEWCRTTPSGLAEHKTMIDVPWVQADLARCTAILKAIRLMTWRLVNSVADNTLGPAESSAVKVFGTEQMVEVYRLLQGILGPVAHLRPGSAGAFLHGELERANRAAQINTFGGGVNEIQRELVATAGLGIERGR
jgi:alkylation response protein AidB-like acyl-CoA dehydrogenase